MLFRSVAGNPMMFCKVHRAPIIIHCFNCEFVFKTDVCAANALYLGCMFTI